MVKEFTEVEFRKDYDLNHEADYESHLVAVQKLTENCLRLSRGYGNSSCYFTGDAILRLSYDTNLPSGNAGSAAISQAMSKFRAWISLNVLFKNDVYPLVLQDLEKILGEGSVSE